MLGEGDCHIHQVLDGGDCHKLQVVNRFLLKGHKNQHFFVLKTFADC